MHSIFTSWCKLQSGMDCVTAEAETVKCFADTEAEALKNLNPYHRVFWTFEPLLRQLRYWGAEGLGCWMRTCFSVGLLRAQYPVEGGCLLILPNRVECESHVHRHQVQSGFWEVSGTLCGLQFRQVGLNYFPWYRGLFCRRKHWCMDCLPGMKSKATEK